MEDDSYSYSGTGSDPVVMLEPFIVTATSEPPDTTGSDDWFNNYRNEVQDDGNPYFMDDAGPGTSFLDDLFNFAGSAVRNLTNPNTPARAGTSSGGSSGGSSSSGSRPTTTTTNTSQTINNFVNSPVGIIAVIIGGLILYKNFTR